MSDESDQFRYLFTVRQRFGETPTCDSFYQLRMPSGITGDQARVMTKLDEKWCKNEIAEDTQSLSGMKLRLRFNADMFPHVCLVRTHCEITAKDLDMIVAAKHASGELIDFLDESAVK